MRYNVRVSELGRAGAEAWGSASRPQWWRWCSIAGLRAGGDGSSACLRATAGEATVILMGRERRELLKGR